MPGDSEAHSTALMVASKRTPIGGFFSGADPQFSFYKPLCMRDPTAPRPKTSYHSQAVLAQKL